VNTQTPLQMLADTLAETAQTSAESAEALLAQFDANDRARNEREAAKVARAMAACPVMRNSRTMAGRCVR